MQSRYPSRAAVRSQTAGHYAVFVGFSDLFDAFQPCLGQTLDTTAHGHLFAPERVELQIMPRSTKAQCQTARKSEITIAVAFCEI